MCGAEHVERLVGDVAVGDHDRVQPVLVGDLGAVEDVLEPDGRLVVGPGHAAAPVVVGEDGEVADGERAQVAGDRRRVGVGDLPVLAVTAGEVAADAAQGQHRRAGEEVVQRLLLDGVGGDAADAPVGDAYRVPSRFCRARQAPLLPSAITQRRGQTRHWTAPSSRRS